MLRWFLMALGADYLQRGEQEEWEKQAAQNVHQMLPIILVIALVFGCILGVAILFHL